MKIEPSLFERACILAVKAHNGQTRKYTGEPYVCHTLEVAGIVRKAFEIGDSTPWAIHTTCSAAVLHDVLEDTPTPSEVISNECNYAVLALVKEVTDVSGPGDGNRATRKALDREHLAKASTHGKSIKLADVISNTQSIVRHDRAFAKVYLQEMEALLPLLKGGHTLLYRWAEDTVESAVREIYK